VLNAAALWCANAELVKIADTVRPKANWRSLFIVSPLYGIFIIGRDSPKRAPLCARTLQTAHSLQEGSDGLALTAVF
jgi:hypothetical protein